MKHNVFYLKPFLLYTHSFSSPCGHGPGSVLASGGMKTRPSPQGIYSLNSPTVSKSHSDSTLLLLWQYVVTRSTGVALVLFLPPTLRLSLLVMSQEIKIRNRFFKKLGHLKKKKTGMGSTNTFENLFWHQFSSLITGSVVIRVKESFVLRSPLSWPEQTPMVAQKPKHEARTTSSHLSQKGDAAGRTVTCFPSSRKAQLFPLSRGLPQCMKATSCRFWRLFKALSETQTHLWYGFQVINVNDSQVCCVGNSSNNRLTIAQFDDSGGGWQTAALSVVIPKGAKSPLQRQLDTACSRGKVTTYLVADRHSPGVPHDANTSACSVKAVNPTQCRAESRRWGQIRTLKKSQHKERQKERYSSFPQHKPWQLGIRDRRPSSRSPRCQPATPHCRAWQISAGSAWTCPYLSTVSWLPKHSWRHTVRLCSPWNEVPFQLSDAYTCCGGVD